MFLFSVDEIVYDVAERLENRRRDLRECAGSSGLFIFGGCGVGHDGLLLSVE